MNQPSQSEKDATSLQGLPPAQIKGLIGMRLESIDAVARAMEEQPNRLSDTINRKRRNQRIRRKLSEHLNISYEILWGEAPPREKAESGAVRAAA